MRLRHNVPIKAIEEARRLRPAEPMSERYEQELDAARRKAHRAWKAAERNLRSIERKAAKTPTPEVVSLRDHTRLEVLARLDELRRIEELMRGPVTGHNWSGKGSVRITPKGRAL